MGIFCSLLIYQRYAKARQKARMNELFTNLAHELLTPLTILTASIDHTLGNSTRHKDDYYTMILNIQRMQHLLQQILETSKQQSGNLKLLVANGDVMAHIRTTSRAVEPLMQKKGIDYSIQCTPSTMRGWIDTDKIDKIIFNLLSNAAKYTPANGKVWLTATTNNRFDKIYIEVKDTGAGMNSHQLKHLYEHFYDGDYRKHHTTGNGLGLAITRDLVSLHNGKIECESHEGVGTTFLVTLPINKEAYKKEQIDEINPISMATPEVAFIDNANMPQPTDSTTDADEQASEDAYKILVVDDNTELLYMLKRLLSATYHVRVALNGMEALEHVANHTFDLVISDVMMPKIDGYELTRRLKANPETCHLPIILLTACTQAENHEQALKAGADDYVTKPFKLNDLKLRINNLIENRKRIQHDFANRTIEEAVTMAHSTNTPDNLFMSKALDCIHNHLTDSDYDRDAFASDMGMSQSSLYNKLRSITGMSVSDFIRDIRLKEDKRIIIETPGIRVGELAYKVGYKDPKYFATSFKKHYGMRPTEFIDKMSMPNHVSQPLSSSNS